MMNKNNILRTSPIALLVILGFSFASYQTYDEKDSVVPATSEDTTTTQIADIYTSAYVDSINAILDTKNDADAKTIAKTETTADVENANIPHRSTWGTSMRSAPIHTVKKGKVLRGVASYYHDKFVGRKTANGEIFSQKRYTAACNSLPLGTYLKVTNLANNKTVVVKVNDRLAKHNKRVVDLSKCSARKIGSIRAGLAKVQVEVIPASEAKSILATY